ncbi:MAG: signal recognition particle-docking protein FtsY [Chloroflexi bacterium]|nr:signal recognition particle-docking protein FtsY [Chloroflexota bacterium]
MEKMERSLRPTRETWFRRISGLFQRRELDSSLWDELEELLLGADVGLATTAKLIASVRGRAKAERMAEPGQVRRALQEEMVRLLQVSHPVPAASSSPRVLLVVGVNGTGKTTSIAKLAYRLRQEGNGVLLAAADTFRAAAIEQLQAWASRLGVEVIAHGAGGDPGAVVFDAIQAARSRGLDAVLVDTAGRLHTKYNLMEELKKLRRVIEKAGSGLSTEVLLVLDATTGQNGLLQAQHFTQAVGVSSVLLAKVDGTAKGGIVLAITDQLVLPIRFLGTGEGLEDLADFRPDEFVKALFSGD